MSKGTIFPTNANFFHKKKKKKKKKNADISKIKGALVLKGIISETIYVCVLTCQIWGF